LAFDFVRGPLHLGTGPRDETAVLAALVVAASAAALAIPWRWLGIATTTAVALAIVSYAGGVFRPTAVLQPYRYVVPLAGLLAIAAAPLWNAARQRKWAAVFLAMVVLVTADRVRVASRSGDYLGAGPSRGDRWALATLRTLQAGAPVAASPGRVLLEGEWTVDAVDGRAAARRVHYSYLSFERLLGGELLGAPAMGIGVPQEHASFWRGRFLGRPLASYDATSFRAACDVYDIAWVLTAREDSLQRLESFGPAVSLVAASGPFGIFRVNRRAKRLWKGRGTAGSDGHTIEAQLPDSSPAVLAYHWIEGLEATPAAELGPIRVDPTSPARFIEIRPPSPGRYRIRLPASGR
jgi:hypothetical protein